MYPHQTLHIDGSTVVIRRQGRTERHEFQTPEEATARVALVTEALSWVGTPFRDCADVKGRNGAVDCAMLLTRCAVDTGLVPPFDPRPYSPRQMLHTTEDRAPISFLKILAKFGAKEVERPRIGDVHVYLFGRMFSHGGFHINDDEIVHAYGAAGFCIPSAIDDPLLSFIPVGSKQLARPVRYFDIWSR
jgi:hypothetical protein